VIFTAEDAGKAETIFTTQAAKGTKKFVFIKNQFVIFLFNFVSFVFFVVQSRDLESPGSRRGRNAP
jgi:hypothetical protein